MTEQMSRPFGFWQSPLTAEQVAAGALRFGGLQVEGETVFWSEGRPAEQGRAPVLAWCPGSGPREILPRPYSARSRVHEYGGGEFLAAGDAVYVVNDANQQIYEARDGDVRQLTDLPRTRFADLQIDRGRGRIIAVAERHDPAADGHAHPENFIAAMPLPGGEPARALTRLATGRDFYASPRLSPDGRRLAFLAWDLPHMPWDEAALYIAEFDGGGRAGTPVHVAGGGGSACFQPEWSEDGTLHFVWDADGWGNLFQWDGGALRQVSRIAGELSKPLWSFNLKSYALLGGGRALVSYLRDGQQHLGLLDLARDHFEEAEHPFTAIAAVAASSRGAACLGVTAQREIAVYWLGSASPISAPAVIRESSAPPDPAYVSAPAPVEIPSRSGDAIFGTLYLPRNPEYLAPRESPPPLIVNLHGGPTSNATRGLKSRTAFFTTRGFAWLDLDYSGSTGYGRAYRERLTGQWGLRDVTDTIDAARFVCSAGLAEPGALFLTGSSSGGYTVLMTLAQTNIFRAAASFYGICDLRDLQRTTHKFEAGYISTLVGARLDDNEARFMERSALTFAQSIRTPLILFQGSEDKIVPPEQSAAIAGELERGGVQVVYRLFEGEGHGFRRAETIACALTEELEFYRGFLPGA
jgi:dipeptidyl aminopeptidase/acylaminoacyl peptidase